ncbi:DUF6369 family protein [uncultured Zobellia sp.]|uniref:DUF6369 family protein n=1 Tax=uncultured Zobellia sp. TaxID=255433 RepID=UPI002593F848|nr:DUF6369 family protein [uncultured Zobellia sp.]
MAYAIVFIALLLFYLILGIKFSKDNVIFTFMLWTVILPLTSALAIIHTRFQINVYYAFAIFPLVFYLSNTFVYFKIAKNVFLASGIVLAFISFYLCYTLLLNPGNLVVINIAKDVKPLLFVALGFVFLDMLKNTQVDWNSKLADKILKYHCFASVIWFIVFNSTNLAGTVSNDAYFEINETRYAAIGTSYVLLYFIAGLSSNKKFNGWDVAYIAIPLFLAGNRTMFFIFGILYVANLFLSTDNVTGLLKKIFLFVLGTFALVLGVFNLNEKLKERIISMFDYDLVMEQLFSKRFSPFIEELATFEWYHYIFGKGIGETLFIPWFVYRKNIDNFNISMDNIYMTMYVKYGVFSLIIYLLLLIFIFKTKTNQRFKILLTLYFFISGLTMAFIYQTKFLFILLVLTGFGFVNAEYSKAEKQ